MARSERESLLASARDARTELSTLVEEQAVTKMLQQEMVNHNFGLAVRKEAEFKVLKTELDEVVSLGVPLIMLCFCLLFCVCLLCLLAQHVHHHLCV